MSTVTDIDADVKVCKGCGEAKPREEFPLKFGENSKSPIARTKQRVPRCKPCHREHRRKLDAVERDRKRRKKTGHPCDREPMTRLNAATVALWLGRRERALLRYHGSRDEQENGRKLLARDVGSTERSMNRMISGQNFQYRVPNQQVMIPLDTVDRWLVNAGEPWVLRELFPGLFRWDDRPELNLDNDIVLPDFHEDDPVEDFADLMEQAA